MRRHDRMSLMLLLLFVAAASAASGVGGASPQLSRSKIQPQSKTPAPTSKRTLPKALKSKGVKNASVKNGIATSSSSSFPTASTALLGCLCMVVIEKLVKRVLIELNIKFPAMLGGCIALFTFLLAMEKVNSAFAEATFDFLKPGADLVAKWFSMLFVPGLVLLPLSPSIGNNVEIAKTLLVCVIGFVYTAATTAYAVLALRLAQGAIKSPSNSATPTQAGVASAAKPYSAETLAIFSKASIGLGLLSVYATKTKVNWAKPIETALLTAFTVASYVWGARLPHGFVKFVHPLVTSSVAVLLLIQTLALATGSSQADILRSYKSGSFDILKVGSGDIFLYLGGTGVISFAVSMYSRRRVIFSNLAVLLTAMLVSSAGSMLSTAALVRLIALGGGVNGSLIRLSILSRNVTTALSMAITAMLGGDISIAAAIVCLTGVLGGTYGKALMNALGIADPITRGLGIGSSSQGLGVAAIADEPDAFPFAAISMVLTAIAATALVSIPSFRDTLIQVATGTKG